ncbi:MAG: hypothetical protein Q9175_002906 [Cornicularia normoerica]
MAEGISSAALVGCTGLVGSQIITTLSSLSSHPTVHAIARRDIPASPPNIHSLIESDSSKWPSSFKSLSPTPSTFLSGLGTTTAQAGSFEAQRKIDFHLNLSLLPRSPGSSKMKAELDEAVKELGFPYTVIVKPGLLVGTRKDSRPSEAVFRAIAKGMGAISKGWLTDVWAQNADVIGRAAVAAGMQCLEGKREEGVWVVSQSDIIRLGRTEWKGENS